MMNNKLSTLVFWVKITTKNKVKINLMLMAASKIKL